jgi:hypothetical protein
MFPDVLRCVVFLVVPERSPASQIGSAWSPAGIEERCMAPARRRPEAQVCVLRDLCHYFRLWLLGKPTKNPLKFVGMVLMRQRWEAFVAGKSWKSLCSPFRTSEAGDRIDLMNWDESLSLQSLDPEREHMTDSAEFLNLMRGPQLLKSVRLSSTMRSVNEFVRS